ncbi:MurR/RpiR family transcriptional regulator [Enterococcus sp. LJL128]|uniref:MurR/RpiR family transcriptional regulator n=1 Tax=Enterococcus sp. LJL51 TaxID=3416656 RepID=UPI003CF0C4E5
MLFLDYNPDLSPIDLEIYKYIAAHMDQVIYMRIRELAQVTHSSTASILRFCRKFECEGFSEFKVRLSLYLESQSHQTTIHTVDETSFSHFIQRSTESFYQERLRAAAELLAEKELVLFVGVGSSKIIAEYGALYFSSIFSMAFNIDDPVNHPVSFFNKNIARNVCVIALSVSGKTTAIIDYLNHFIANESSIISITNSEKSEIAKLSDVNIPYYISTESIGDSDITSQVPALYTIEYLAKEVRKLKHEKSGK